MRVLGFIFLTLFLSLGIVALDYHLSGIYLRNFLDNHFVETFAALVGFNIAAVVFLVGQLLTLEERHDIEFNKVRREIKHNAYFLLISFVVSLLLLIFRPTFVIGGDLNTNLYYHVCNIFILSVFSLAVFSIFEILQSVFILGRTPGSQARLY